MIVKRNRGSLSVDFLISITVCCLLLIFVILTTLTFSLAEVAQYIAYSSARAYFVGHNNLSVQEESAKNKYVELKNKFFPSGKALSKWFCLQPDGNSLEFGIYDEFGNNNRKHGVAFKFISHVMTMNIPFLGDVGDGNSGDRCQGAGSDGFVFPITAFLGREVSTAECNIAVREFVTGGNGC